MSEPFRPPPRFPLTPEMRASMRAARERMVERARGKGLGKRVSYALQAALLFPLIGVLKLMPVDVASRFGGWFGRQVIFRLIDRKAHYPTMRVVFPNETEAELDAILLGMCENIGRVVGEIVHMRDFIGAGNPRMRITGAERVAAIRATGRPVLLVAGHFGNWELTHVAMRAAGFDGLLVVQHPNNPHVVEWIATERLRSGPSMQIGAGDGVYASLRRQLKAGGAALMFPDQRVLNGIKAPFFGIETTTNLIPARVARDLGAAVVMVKNRRTRGANFEIDFEEPITLTPGPDRAADERTFSGRINAFFEAQIVAAPAFWLWGHPRFDDVLFELDQNGKRVGEKLPKSG
jgi:Kdo2-lipid IVA lauroyltransferase/acyltransferase